MSRSATQHKRAAYPAYKPSGIEWLGEVPEHWEIKALRRVVLSISNGSSVTQVEFSDSTFRITRIETISQGVVDFSKTGYVEWHSSLNRYLIHKGDILFSHINSISMVGNCAIFDSDEFLYNGMNVLLMRPCSSIDSKWLWRVISSKGVRWSFGSLAKPAINQASLTTMEIKAFRIPVPPLPEQRAIAAFLDRETARIDALTAKKRRQIELLQEKRSALISHAVTKGLDPNAPMKDSGIEWLGEIPEHWGMKSVKYMTQILRGKFTHRPRNDPRMYDGPYPFIQTSEVSSASKYVREYHQTLSEDGFAVSKMFPKGTLVMTIAANIGDMAILDFEACFPDSIVGFVPRRGVVLEFLYFLFIGLRPALLSTATLNTQFNLNIDRIGCVLAALPPIPEQRAIAAFLDRETARIDALIKKVGKSIELLREYRTALISAAVTGKIDVRGETI